MLKIENKGLVINETFDPASITGDLDVDRTNAYLAGLKSGRVVSLGPDGLVLCDGATDNPLGLLVNDALPNPLENQPGIASGRGAVAYGSNKAVTDQIDTAMSFCQRPITFRWNRNQNLD